MLAHANFGKAKPALSARDLNETHWHLVYGIAFLILVLLANQGAMLNEGTKIASSTKPESVNEAVNRPAINAEAISSAKIAAALERRLIELSLEGRIRIQNKPNQALAISINTGLLFSEGDNQLSRAGNFALQSLMENTNIESLESVTIILEKRTDTSVEYSFGKDITKLQNEREAVLLEFLSTFQVKANIRQ